MKKNFKTALHAMETAWSALGQPRLITACSSCFKTIKDHLPQIPIEPLWPHLSSALSAHAPPKWFPHSGHSRPLLDAR